MTTEAVLMRLLPAVVAEGKEVLAYLVLASLRSSAPPAPAPARRDGGKAKHRPELGCTGGKAEHRPERGDGGKAEHLAEEERGRGKGGRGGRRGRKKRAGENMQPR